MFGHFQNGYNMETLLIADFDAYLLQKLKLRTYGFDRVVCFVTQSLLKPVNDKRN